MKKFILAILLINFIACAPQTDLDKNGEPKQLIIAVYGGSGDNNGSIAKAMEVLKSYFEKKLHKKVVLYITTNYTSVIEAIHSKKVQIAYLSPFSYVLAAQHKDITPLVAIGQNGKPNLYHSVIFCNARLGIHSLEELKSKSKDLSLTFSDPASTSGHLVPFSYLNAIGLSPDSSFKQIVFSGSHAATVLAVATGKIDIGCSTREYGVELMIKKGLVKEDNLRILWESEPIVASPIVMRNDVNINFTARIRDLYMNMHKDDVAVFKSYVNLFHKNADELSYIPIDDSLYNGVRNIANHIKEVELLKNH